MTPSQAAPASGVPPEVSSAAPAAPEPAPPTSLPAQKGETTTAAPQTVHPTTEPQAGNVLVEKVRVGHGPFSSPAMTDRLPALLTRMRSASGIPRETKSAVTPNVEASVGGNMAVSLTDIEGAANGGLVVGRSPEAGGKAQLESPFAPKTDPVELPFTHRHAEQELAERFFAANGGTSAAALQGKTLWILVEAVPCAQCMNDVLPALSAKFPGLTIEVKNLEGSRILRYRNGVLLNR
jgi:hypothetical protein